MQDGRGSPDSGPDSLASVVNVSKSFGATRALIDASMTVGRRESRALLGRNGAGKSTLVGILTGLFAPDSGEVFLDGEPAPPLGARGEWQKRVACVYQRPTVVPGLTVAENLFLNRQPTRGGRIAWKQMYDLAAERLEAWGMSLDVRRLVESVSVDERQTVEIIRALESGTRLVILDEPTAQLEGREITRLFERIRTLQEAGVSFIYISHHLSESFEICDTVTVLRDGRVAAEGSLAEMTERDLVSAMVGPEYDSVVGRSERKAPIDESVRLRVDGLSAPGAYEDVSVTVRGGECVGLAGLVGCGKGDFIESVVGIQRPQQGTIQVDGKEVPKGKPAAAIAAGIGYVPGDRYAAGFVPDLDVAENLTMAITDELGPMGWVRSDRRDSIAATLVDRFEIKASRKQAVAQLSGGNQQKVVMGRALSSDPGVLVLANPTAGVDIAAKELIFEAIYQAQMEGRAVLIATDDLDELRICDRVLVMFEGRITASFDRGWDRDELVSAIEGMTLDG